MKHLCCSKWIKIFLFIVFIGNIVWAKEGHDIAFYYAKEPSDTFMQHFEWIVVDPDVIHPSIKRHFQKKLFAYVSVGEIEPWRPSNKKYNHRWILGENKAWDSRIADYTNREYQHFLLTKMEELYIQGYRNFFLDTLDAPFEIISSENNDRYASALNQLLKSIRERFPNAKIVANRGFEAEEGLCKYVDAVAAESLYQGINTKNFTYRSVSQPDREWISTQLRRYQKCGLEAIAIDYVDPKNSKLRRSTAEKIVNDGFIPYIGDYKLHDEGIGKKKRFSREVLILYNGDKVKDHDPIYSEPFLLLSMPLEYLGYIPHLHDVSKGLPDLNQQSFAGIIIWDSNVEESTLFKWVKEAIERETKILFLNNFGFSLTPERLAYLSLKTTQTSAQLLDEVNITAQDPMVGYEVKPILENQNPLVGIRDGVAIIQATNKFRETFTPAAIMPWGGFALNQSFMVYVDGESYWAIDPVLFFKKALNLTSVPAPTATTENGSRLWLTHIDGDGMIEKTRFRPDEYAVETLYREILTRYRIPHSVSVIIGEVSKEGVAGDISERMQQGVRQIFKLPYVEPASHSYSHPFRWKKAISSDNDGTYTLHIKGYEFSLENELQGSLEYINTRLSADKNSSLFFWTGDCNPPEEVLAVADEANIMTINGGDTTIQKESPWLSYVAPMSIRHGAYRQILAPMQNENVYTGNWTFPKWGYRKAIETMKMTDVPRRYKPINIYYHFYSASLKPSLDALKEVYEYAMKQQTLPLYVSDYIRIADDFYRTDITQKDDGWLIRNGGYLRTLRIDKELGYPDIARSKGIVGFNDHVDGRYIHLDGRGEYELYLRAEKPNLPYLIEANGRIAGFDETGLSIKSSLPIRMKWFLPEGCQLDLTPKLTMQNKDHEFEYSSGTIKEVRIAPRCR